MDAVNRWALQRRVDGRWVTVQSVNAKGGTMSLEEAQMIFAFKVSTIREETRIAAFRQHSVTGHPSAPIIPRASVA